VYETAPIGPPQPDFLNAAALVTFEGTPEQLLDVLLGIEASLGRSRTLRWGPRTIDLDILWCEGIVLETARLSLPHPRLRERAFALIPMAEVCPEARDPVTGERYRTPVGDIVMTRHALEG
jgi:2-amino-4-hydroxy-6-hydroxymethyldihydropteridine diphosphokinase